MQPSGRRLTNFGSGFKLQTQIGEVAAKPEKRFGAAVWCCCLVRLVRRTRRRCAACCKCYSSRRLARRKRAAQDQAFRVRTWRDGLFKLGNLIVRLQYSGCHDLMGDCDRVLGWVPDEELLKDDVKKDPEATPLSPSTNELEPVPAVPADDPPGGLDDYSPVMARKRRDDAPVRWLQAAVRCSAHALLREPREVPSQLLGRLLGGAKHNKDLASLLKQADAWQDRGGGWHIEAEGWLKPLTPSLATRVVPADLLKGSRVRAWSQGKWHVGTVVQLPDKKRKVKEFRVQSDSEEHGVHLLTEQVEHISSVAAEGCCLEGHGTSALSLCALVTKTGRIIVATGGADASVRIWLIDDEAEQEAASLRGHQGPVNSVALLQSHNRTLLVSGSEDKTVKLWCLYGGEAWRFGMWRTVSISSSQIGQLLGHRGPVNCVAALAATQKDVLVLTGSDDATLRVWSVEGKQLAILRRHHTAVKCVASLLDRSKKALAVSGCADHTVRLWSMDLPIRKEQLHVFRGHRALVRCISALLTRDGRALAVSGSDDATVRVWSLDAGVERGLAVLSGHKSSVWTVSALQTQDGRSLALSGGDDSTLRLWSLDVLQRSAGKQHELRTFSGHGSFVHAVSTVLTKQGRALAISSSVDTTMRTWWLDADLGKALPLFPGHDGAVKSVSALWTYNSRALAVTAGVDATVRVWNLYCPRQKLGELEGWARWDAATLRGHKLAVNSVCALQTSDQRLLAISGSDDCTVIVWSIHEGDEGEVAVLKGHTGPVLSISALQTCEGMSVAASASADGTLRVWCLDEDAEHALAVFNPHGGWVESVSLIQTHDGRVLAFAGSDDGKVSLWSMDVYGKEDLIILNGHAGHVTTVATVEDEYGCALAVSGSHDCTIGIWSLDAGAEKEIGILRGHVSAIASLRLHATKFSGVVVISCDTLGNCNLWDLNSRKILDGELPALDVLLTFGVRARLCNPSHTIGFTADEGITASAWLAGHGTGLVATAAGRVHLLVSVPKADITSLVEVEDTRLPVTNDCKMLTLALLQAAIGALFCCMNEVAKFVWTCLRGWARVLYYPCIILCCPLIILCYPCIKVCIASQSTPEKNIAVSGEGEIETGKEDQQFGDHGAYESPSQHFGDRGGYEIRRWCCHSYEDCVDSFFAVYDTLTDCPELCGRIKFRCSELCGSIKFRCSELCGRIKFRCFEFKRSTCPKCCTSWERWPSIEEWLDCLFCQRCICPCLPPKRTPPYAEDYDEGFQGKYLDDLYEDRRDDEFGYADTEVEYIGGYEEPYEDRELRDERDSGHEREERPVPLGRTQGSAVSGAQDSAVSTIVRSRTQGSAVGGVTF